MNQRFFNLVIVLTMLFAAYMAYNSYLNYQLSKKAMVKLNQYYTKRQKWYDSMNVVLDSAITRQRYTDSLIEKALSKKP